MRLICKICGNPKNNTSYIVREMMFGFRDEFEYFQCSNCECLQISEIPKNLNKYYPAEYYSFSNPRIIKSNKLLWFFKRKRTSYSLTGKGIIGYTLLKLFGEPHLPNWVKSVGISLDTKILDVGCGGGHRLINLNKKGFSDLTGFDPYIPEDKYYKNGVRILKRDLSETSESFEFIMMHHSFEHVLNPIDTFNKLHEKLALNGLVLIRIPIVSSFAWKKYKNNWVQLDAPRHLFLHSLKSMEMIAKSTGFEIESIEFDSTEFQFWGSEQYLRDIPLCDAKSYKNGIDGSVFTKNDISNFKMKAKELNRSKEGDSACFILQKKK